jgi:hypothetical protein
MRLPGFRPRLLAVALCAVPALAQADDSYPTIPDDQDYMCETIARSPGASVPPGDRAWFTRTCACTEAKVCGRAGSRRYAARLEAGSGETQAQREATARIRAWRSSAIQSTERLRQGYRACRAAGTTNCEAQMAALEEACNQVGLTTWDDCLARE